MASLDPSLHRKTIEDVEADVLQVYIHKSFF
jgi:hypothetical protein